jgi:hypothetical protein
MIRSPRSGSSIITARSFSGGIKKGFYTVDSIDVDERWLAGQLPDLSDKLTGSLFNDRGAVPQRIASRDSH